MKSFLKLLLPLSLLPALSGLAWAQDAEKQPAPVKILLVAGGCCHDYAAQWKLLKAGIEERLNAEVTVEFNPSKGTDATFKVYEAEDWATGYDVIIHDECSASVTDPAYVKRILDAHRNGTPAVNLHCAMHSYRWGNFKEPVKAGADNAGWYEMIGVQSTGHGPQLPINVAFSETAHPITKGLENWTTINEELYNNVQIFDGTTALAKGTQAQAANKKNPNAKPNETTTVVVWTTEFGPKKTRIFSTTLGHNNDTVADGRYLDLVTRGLLWSTGHLAEDGSVEAGYGK